MASNSNPFSSGSAKPDPLARYAGTLPKTAAPLAINRQILNSWKEIATYLGRGVRTVQRYERAYRLPVRRPAGKDRAAVMALSDELDTWVSNIPTRPLGHVRPVLLILDSFVAGALSERRIALEHAHFNVLAAANVDEALATADKFNVDGFVFDCQDNDNDELCESLKDRFPKKPLFVLVPESHTNGTSPTADYVIPAGNVEALVKTVMAVLGEPRAE